MNFNKIMLAGNITRDIELRHTPSNIAVAQIGLAVNERYTSASGEKKESVVFVDCEAFGKTAEAIAKYLGKGKPIFIEGRLKLDQWKDKADGSNRSKLKVVVESFQFVGAKSDTEQTRATPARASSPAPEPMHEEDIPF